MRQVEEDASAGGADVVEESDAEDELRLQGCGGGETNVRDVGLEREQVHARLVEAGNAGFGEIAKIDGDGRVVGDGELETEAEVEFCGEVNSYDELSDERGADGGDVGDLKGREANVGEVCSEGFAGGWRIACCDFDVGRPVVRDHLGESTLDKMDDFVQLIFLC